ncbi:LOW QUALITY PROTEIN: cilia- and flagella-associated protein 74 [Rhea pennata]|uniref:LOW QUALITY PROTEIN: cilia- and flagella-associated protein 74 n=1 Tax=Rhea pennata TaxID=8795 RepID=UPI002E26F92D
MEDAEFSDRSEEQKTLLPFLKREEKEDKAGQFSNLKDYHKERKPEESDDGGETGDKDLSEGVGDESDSNMESLEHYLDNNNNIPPMKYADRVHILTLHRNLKQLNDVAKEKECVVPKNRDKLSTCQLQIKILAKQLEYKGNYDVEYSQFNVHRHCSVLCTGSLRTALFHLQAVRMQQCTELENKKDLESKIALTLKECVYEVWQIEAEQGKSESFLEQLDEEELEMQYRKQAELRIWREKIAARKAEQNQQAREKKEEEAQKEYEEKHKEMLEDVQRNHEKAVYFLRKTMTRIHEKNADEEQKTQKHMERRMQAVLSLKNSIASNRENLRTLQLGKKARAFEAKKQEMKMREAILAEGGNVAKEIFLHKRLAEYEKEKRAFQEQQKSRRIEIVARILQENVYFHKQKNSQSCTKAVKRDGKLEDSLLWRMKTWQYIEKTCEHSATAIPQESWYSSSICSSADKRIPSIQEFPEKACHDVFCESKEDEKEKDKPQAEPEFPGLWNQECDLHKIPKEETEPKLLATKIMKKEILKKKMGKLQTGIFHQQIVSGGECEECPFYSKPNLIHFKDFDVGKIYKKKIVLTNASYSVNFCRLAGISEWLKDFISIHFDPPGQMSAGMSCEVGVTFKPMINETLEGEITFMAQTGSFSVPLKCTTKKCVLALDKELVDFGTQVVGERISRTVTLTNCGALGTRFKVQMSADDSRVSTAIAKSSPGRMISQQFSDSFPEERVSNSPVKSVFEKKDQTCHDHSEEMTYCVTRMEQQRTETSLSKDLSQDALNCKPDLEADDAEDVVEPFPEETPTEIMLGKVTEGEIGPFNSVKLQIIFTPAIPGDVRAEFVITFDNSPCKPLCFSAIGVSIDVPVWVPNPNIDLKICMYDRLYQDCIVIQSRAKAALRLKFEVCKELSRHMELLPKTGYIQAQSSFNVQLKFLPRHSLPEDAGNYFDEETRVLEVPMTILIADKTKPVNFTVHAIVTTSDMEISPAEIHFGYCTIYEAVQTNVTLTNKSILPQEFGFVGLPEFVEIQPNDGLGILLPLESLTLDIIFKANKAKEYNFELTCKSEINRQFKLSCKAVGVHPPLELSHSLVQFAATALNGVSTATLHVINSHVSVNSFTHAVPRIGNGEIACVGPTSFEFHVPEDCPVTITPSVGTVLPGKKSLIQVSFRPILSDQLIREEAMRLCRAAVTRAEIQTKKKDEKTKKLSISSIRQQSSKQLARDRGSKYLTSVYSSEQPKSEEIKPTSEAYMAAQTFLIRNFRGRFEKYIIPCFVASGDTDGKRSSEDLSCSPYNTLYLELHCPAVAPSVVVTSDNGENTINFGDVAVGHRRIKQITIQNISPEQLELGFSILNPNGPFLLVRPVGMLQPGENKTLIISFCPNENKWFFETLDIWTVKTNLTLSIIGHGVMPSTVCSVEEVLNMGYVIAKEKVTSTFKIQNTSILNLRYSIQLDSLSSTRDKDQQKLPSFMTSSLQRTDFVGTQNYNGLSVFSIFPIEGEIVAGKSQDFTVTFSPDHESLYYSDRLKVVLFGKEVAHVIHLKGAARYHPMFVEGGIPLDVPIESLAVTLSMSSQEAAKEELQEPVKSILLVLEYIEGESSVVPAMTELKVGAIRTAQFASKKNVEFNFDNLPLLQQKGFTIESSKGTVDRGQVKCISVSWVPPADFHADSPLIVTTLLTLKGAIKESYRIIFIAKVASASC